MGVGSLMKKILSGVVAAGVVLVGVGAQTANAASNISEDTLYKLGQSSKVSGVSVKSTSGNHIDLRLDGGYLYDDTVSPILKNGRVLVPFRPIAEYMEATLKWDSKAKKVTITRKGKTVEITNGDKFGIVNGTKKALDEPVQIIEGRVFVPLRFVTESLGAKVNWTQKEKRVDVSVFKEGNEKFYYTNTKGELGAEITSHQANARLDQGLATNREIVRSFTVTDLTDGTSKMYTTHLGKYIINGETFNTISLIEHSIDAKGNIGTGTYNIYAYNDKEDAEVLSFEKEGKVKEFKTTQEVLQYTSYELLKDTGFIKEK